MEQITVLIDAGYIYAQGSFLITGKKHQRPEIILRPEPLVEHFRGLAGQIAPNARLLRIYWYDGLRRGGQLSTEQEMIGLSRDCKLRLGLLNAHGKQKGVDSLIVTDLIDLARNKAMTDALIVSGDEDIRVGVSIAQTYGVRVHLIGIHSPKGSQSIDLLREADSHREIGQTDVTRWMAIRPSSSGAALHSVLPTAAPVTGSIAAITEDIVDQLLKEMEPETLRQVMRLLENKPRMIPGEIDRPTLKMLTDRLERDPTETEKKSMRATVLSRIRMIGR